MLHPALFNFALTQGRRSWPCATRLSIQTLGFAKTLHALDHDIVVVADLIDPNGAIGESVKSHNVRPTKRGLRTHKSSAHGHGHEMYKVKPRHGRLAEHSAFTLATFVLETWAE